MKKKHVRKQDSGILSILSTLFILGCLLLVITSGNKRPEPTEIVESYSSRTIENVLDEYSPTKKETTTKAEYSEKDLVCLRRAMYFEIRKKNHSELTAVANVVFNRVKHKQYPNDVCSVLTQSGQFEYVMKGLNSRAKVLEHINMNSIEMDAFKEAEKYAVMALSNQLKDNTNGAVAFHANTMEKPKSKYWQSLKKSVKFDLHTYYK